MCMKWRIDYYANLKYVSNSGRDTFEIYKLWTGNVGNISSLLSKVAVTVSKLYHVSRAKTL
jgi:hypothetical protein